MEKYNFTMNDFRHKCLNKPLGRFQGGYRNIIEYPYDLRHEINTNSFHNNIDLSLKFKLKCGCFASIFVREIMEKSKNGEMSRE